MFDRILNTPKRNNGVIHLAIDRKINDMNTSMKNEVFVLK